MHRSHVPLWGACALALLACSDERLDYITEDLGPEVVDDQLTLRGDFCTSPDANVAFPVKIMFIVDGSGSMQFTDQNRQRVTAVEEVINTFAGSPNVYFKIMVFNANVTATPDFLGGTEPPFTNDISALVPGLADLAAADTVTDYQGTLAVAYAELLRDMESVFSDANRGPAELGRTKYVVIFMSDGLPDPQCQAGFGNDLTDNTVIFPDGINHLCEDQDYLNCLLKVDDPVLGTVDCTTNPGVCDFNGTLCYDIPNSNTLFGGLNNVELAGGADYNQPYQILNAVNDIMELADRYEVGEMRFHAALVSDPLADPAILDLFGDPAQAAPMIEQMAEVGNGEYLEFYGGDDIDFLQINFDTLKQPRVVRSFFVDNRAAYRTFAEQVPDTDFDGLPDELEFELGLNVRRADTDGDGFGDYLEHRRRAFGFNPLDPCIPAREPVGQTCNPGAPQSCTFVLGIDPGGNVVRQYADTDRDGLHDCEEAELGTDDRSPDTDRDGIPDFTDYVSGLNPTVWDFNRDDDQDGVPNGQELEWHLNPLVQQSEASLRDRYRYDRPLTQTLIDGRTCYHFEAKKLRLTPTLDNEDLASPDAGHNEVRLYILENLADDLGGPPLIRTACVRPRYAPPSFKVPATGVIDLVEADFRYLPSSDPIFANPSVTANLFDPQTDCIPFVAP